MHELNMALISKLGWRLTIFPDNLWVKAVKSKYKFSSPLELGSPKGNESTVWKEILAVMPKLQASLCILPRQGSRVSIRDNPWLPSLPLFRPQWKDNIEDAPRVSMVSYLVNIDTGQ